IEKIFAIAERAFAQELFREELVDRPRLRDGADDPILLEHGELHGPVTAEAHPAHENPALVDLRTGLKVIERPAEHPLGIDADLDGRLTGSRSVDREVADAVRENLVVRFGDGLLAAVEAA